jgi:O-antigen ligase
MRLAVILLFPFLGIFNFFRIQGYPEIGLLLLEGFIFSVLFIQFFFKPIISKDGKLFYGMSKKMNPLESIHLKATGLFVLTIVIGLLRSILSNFRDLTTGSAEIIIVISIIIFIYSVVIDAIRKDYFESLIGLFGKSLFILLTLNIFGSFLGINSGIAANYNTDLTNAYPFIDYRILFPFTVSGQILSIQAGIVVIIGIFQLFQNNNIIVFILSVAMIAAGFFILVGHGGRSAMLMLIIAILILGLFNLVKTFLPILLLMSIFFPILVLIDFGILVEYIFDFFGFNFSRNQGDIASFSNRDVIFGIALLSFLVEGTLLNIIFGFGSYGHVVSGISEAYAFLFEYSYANPYEAHVHNSALQILMDYGIFGVLLFIFLTLNSLALLKKTIIFKNKAGYQSNNIKLYTSLYVYLVLTSMTESTITYLSFNVLSIFFILNLIIAFDCIDARFNKKDIISKKY